MDALSGICPKSDSQIHINSLDEDEHDSGSDAAPKTRFYGSAISSRPVTSSERPSLVADRRLKGGAKGA